MLVAPFLTGALSQMQRRQTYDNGQWTVVPSVISWSESYYLSYSSTQTIIVTTTVPCPVYTTYVTTTVCSSCGCVGCGTTSDGFVGGVVCAPKTCSVNQNGGVYYSSTAYGPGEYAPATNNGVYNPQTSYIAASECNSYQPFVATGYAGAGISQCGGGCNNCNPNPVCTDCNPNPGSGYCCIARYCTSSANGAIATQSVPYQFTEYATVVTNGVTTSIPASLCASYANTINLNSQTPNCGGTTPGETTCGVSVVTYSYTTAGATIVAVTTVGQNCGPFALNYGQKLDLISANVLFWLWAFGAAISGIAMIVL